VELSSATLKEGAASDGTTDMISEYAEYAVFLPALL
jgi:hypothetical protein